LSDPFRLTRAKRFGLLEANREEEFAPITKGSQPIIDGKPVFGTPEYAILALSRLHEKWLRQAGYEFVEDASVQTIALKDIIARQRMQRQKHQARLAAKKRQAQVQLTEEQLQQQKKEEEEQARKNQEHDDKESGDIIDPNQTFYRLIELDSTVSYMGENIPPCTKKYESKVDRPDEDFEDQEFVPFYYENNANHFKPALPWGMNQIYRYI